MRKTLGIAASVGGIGLFLLTQAVHISNFLGVLQLPSDIRDALIVLASIPAFIAWGVLFLGLFSGGYLVYDSGHHTAVLAALKKRPFHVDPILALALCLVVIGLILFAVRISNLSTPKPVVATFFSPGSEPEREGSPLGWLKRPNLGIQRQGDGSIQVRTNNNGDTVECRFGAKWSNALSRLNRSDTLKVTGTISDHQNGQQIYLRDCEVA
jgi:hypothetical protein